MLFDLSAVNSSCNTYANNSLASTDMVGFCSTALGFNSVKGTYLSSSDEYLSSSNEGHIYGNECSILDIYKGDCISEAFRYDTVHNRTSDLSDVPGLYDAYGNTALASHSELDKATTSRDIINDYETGINSSPLCKLLFISALCGLSSRVPSGAGSFTVMMTVYASLFSSTTSGLDWEGFYSYRSGGFPCSDIAGDNSTVNHTDIQRDICSMQMNSIRLREYLGRSATTIYNLFYSYFRKADYAPHIKLFGVAQYRVSDLVNASDNIGLSRFGDKFVIFDRKNTSEFCELVFSSQSLTVNSNFSDAMAVLSAGKRAGTIVTINDYHVNSNAIRLDDSISDICGNSTAECINDGCRQGRRSVSRASYLIVDSVSLIKALTLSMMLSKLHTSL